MNIEAALKIIQKPHPLNHIPRKGIAILLERQIIDFHGEVLGSISAYALADDLDSKETNKLYFIIDAQPKSEFDGESYSITNHLEVDLQEHTDIELLNRFIKTRVQFLMINEAFIFNKLSNTVIRAFQAWDSTQGVFAYDEPDCQVIGLASHVARQMYFIVEKFYFLQRKHTELPA